MDATSPAGSPGTPPVPPTGNDPVAAPNSNAIATAVGAIILLILTAGGIYAYVNRPQPFAGGVGSAFDANDFGTALAKVDAALAESPNDAALLALKALVLAQQGSLEFKETELGGQAAVLALQAIAANPGSSEAHRVLAYAYEIQQKYTDAHVEYAKALALDPGNAAAMFGDAHAHDLQGDVVKAEAGYRATLATDPNFAQAHAGLGRILASKGDIAGAIVEFKQEYALTTNTHQRAEAAYSIGQFMLAQGDLRGAEPYAVEATTLEPSYPLTWYGLGKLKIQQSSPDAGIGATAEVRVKLLQEGLDALKKATMLNPRQTVAYVETAYAEYQILKQAGAAGKILDQAATVLPYDITLSVTDKERVQKDINALRALIAGEK